MTTEKEKNNGEKYEVSGVLLVNKVKPKEKPKMCFMGDIECYYSD